MSADRTILLVGDIVDDPDSASERPIHDEDNPSKSEVENLVEWIGEAGYTVDVCGDVRSFIESGHQNKNIIVFPLWRGGFSRNRTAIIPAYCEECNIPFVGGDAYVQTVCQDKSLSKLLSNAVNINTTRELVIRSYSELKYFEPLVHMRPPFVVKPLLSACSIGINDASLCHNNEQARQHAEHLFFLGLGPVLCEEFIQGDEISLCIIEERGTIIQRCVGGYRDEFGQCPFRDRLFTFDDKINMFPTWTIHSLSENLVQNTWKKAEKLIHILGKVGIIRIDGRIKDGVFYLIELTPDIHMSLESIFLGSFNSIGYHPSYLLNKIIQSSVINFQNNGFSSSKC